jgi:hypothetical protein
MADRGDSHFAQIVGGQSRQNGAIDGVLAKRGLVLLKAEGAEPRDEVERGTWTGAGGHEGSGVPAIDRPRRNVSRTRTTRSSARVR